LKTDERRIYDACMNNAPYFAYKIEGKKYGVVQGCCNNWNCPRCGQQRAREEYGRIVAGARELAKTNQLYLMTLTCRGKEMTVDEAENGYLLWTNSLVTKLRAKAKRAGMAWAYASVTERQKRGHPHSHYITTYCPDDGVEVAKGKPKFYHSQGIFQQAKHNTIQTKYLELACIASGLGWQYDISALESEEAGSRYVAKYLFKADMFATIFPKGWNRVRYSQNWPKLPQQTSEAFILMEAMDWVHLSRVAVTVVTKDDGAKKFVSSKLSHSDVIVY